MVGGHSMVLACFFARKKETGFGLWRPRKNACKGVEKAKTRWEALPGGTAVCTTKQHGFGTDALLLTRFCQPHPAWNVADLCAGCGIVLLGLRDAGVRGHLLAVEIAPEATALMEAAMQQNGIPNMEVQTADLRLFRHTRLHDLVTANPPYFAEGPKPTSPARALARHQLACPIGEVCAAAARLLKEGGRFCLCYPPARLAGLFEALAASRLAPKRLQLVRKTPDDTPWLALVDARKNGGEGLTILPDQLLPPGAPLAWRAENGWRRYKNALF